LSGAFGYGVSTNKGNENEGKKGVGEGKGKGKARGGIPDWNNDGDSIKEGIEEEEKEVETNSLDQADDDEGNQELNELVDTILWKVSHDLKVSVVGVFAVGMQRRSSIRLILVCFDITG